MKKTKSLPQGLCLPGACRPPWFVSTRPSLPLQQVTGSSKKETCLMRSVFIFENGTDAWVQYWIGGQCPGDAAAGWGAWLASLLPHSGRFSSLRGTQTLRKIDGPPQPFQAISTDGHCVLSLALHCFQTDKELSSLRFTKAYLRPPSSYNIPVKPRMSYHRCPCSRSPEVRCLSYFRG